MVNCVVVKVPAQAVMRIAVGATERIGGTGVDVGVAAGDGAGEPPGEADGVGTVVAPGWGDWLGGGDVGVPLAGAMSLEVECDDAFDDVNGASTIESGSR
jgi:hypothetical protein